MTRIPFAAIALTILPMTAPAQSADEIAAVKQMFAPLLVQSYQAHREYCGMIGLDENDRMVIGKARRGDTDSCLPRDPKGAVEIIASYHTHGGFDYDADAEMPSVDDLQSDMDEGVDGWVATPGGRLWFLDGQAGVIRQVCGLGCLPQDPDFVEGVSGLIPERMTLDELIRWFEG